MQATASTRLPGAQSDLAAGLYALITYLHKSCTSDLFEAVGAVDLSLTQVKLLHQLDDRSRELTLKQTAEAVKVSFPAASRMVDDLVGRGFVERHEDADDRRMKRIRITERGGEVIRRLNAARLVGLEQFVANLTDDEQQALGELLGQLMARADIASLRQTREGIP